MQAAKRIAKNTGFLYARTGITMFISLYTTRLVLNALGAADFGLFNVVGGAIAMLGFLNASMTTATQRFINYAEGGGNKDKVQRIFNVSVVLHFLIALVAFVLLEIAGYFFFNYVLKIPPERLDITKLIYQYMIISTLFTVISVPYDAVINAHEHMLLYAVFGVIESILKLGIAITLLHITGDRLQAYGLLTALLAIMLLLLRRAYCYKYYTECRINLKKYYDKKLMKEMTGFAGWSLLGSSTSMLTGYGQGIVINMFFAPAVNAAQGIANQVSGQLSVFATNMLKALNPNIAKNEGGGFREQMLKTSMAGSKISFFLLTVIFVPMLTETSYILSIWLKKIPPYAVIFCQLLLVRNLIDQIFTTLAGAIVAVGNIRKFQFTSAIILIFPLIITYYLFSLGMAPYTIYIVFIFYSIVRAMNIMYFSQKLAGLSVKFFAKEVIFRCFLSLSLIVGITLLPSVFMDEGLIRLTTVLILNVIAFFIIAWGIGLSKEEKNKAKFFLRSITFFSKAGFLISRK